MTAPVIFLHGASSSGKTTLAQAIQARADLPFWHMSIDLFRDSGAWPMDRYRSGEFDWQEDRARLFAGFHAMLGAATKTGNPLIIEHILDEAEWLEDLKHRLRDSDVLFVGLHCDLDTLNAREIARGDRPIGSAEQDYHNIHNNLHYDLEVLSEDIPDKNARCILNALAKPHRQSSFFMT